MLSQEEAERLFNRHGVTADLTFDASGLARREYRRLMEKQGKLVAYGVTPCQRFGHALRTRTGDCVWCFPNALGFLKRYSRTQFVYVAGSRSEGLLKIGISEDLEDRIEQLNTQRLACVRDWEILCWVGAQNAGEIETHLHRQFRGRRVPVFYERRQQEEPSRECFSLPYPDVYRALAELCGAKDIREDPGAAFWRRRRRSRRLPADSER